MAVPDLKIRRPGQLSLTQGRTSQISVKSRVSRVINVENGKKALSSTGKATATGARTGAKALKGTVKASAPLRQGVKAQVAAASGGQGSLADSQGKAAATSGMSTIPTVASTGVKATARTGQITNRVVGSRMRAGASGVGKAVGHSAPAKATRRAIEAVRRATADFIRRIIAVLAVKLSSVTVPLMAVLAVVMLVLAVISSFIPSWNAAEEADNPLQGAGITGVPTQYAAAILRAGAICPEVTPALIAAQIQQESGFNPNASNPSGASGIAQFMPSTWASVGKDGDGDGKADVLNAQDAIFTQGHYMCDLVAQLKPGVSAGLYSGSLVDLALAAYNSGVGNVRKHKGVPPFAETQNYVAAIKAAMSKFVIQAGGPVGEAAQSAADLVNSPATNASVYAPETASLPDPTPGAHGAALVTPRTSAMIQATMAAYPQINNAALYCSDAHAFNPDSEHSRGRACDIPFYSCPVNPGRAADPATGTAAGNAAANWLTTNAQSLGVMYVIWRGQIWWASTGTWGPYDGAGGLYSVSDCSGGHYDHIHVSVY